MLTADQLVDRLLEADKRADSPIFARKRKELADIQVELAALPDHSDYGSDQYRRKLETDADKLIAYLKVWGDLYATCESVERVQLDWHLSGKVAEIELFQVPVGQRRQGFGTQAYWAWESALPKGVQKIRLFAADTGKGPSDAFWLSLGFDYDAKEEVGGDREDLRYEDRQWMSKARS